MSRTLHWNDEYCPNGHKWVFCQSSTLYPDFYYCPKEDKFWEPTVREVKEPEIIEQYNNERPEAMRKYAKRGLAMEKIQYMPYEEVIKFAERKDSKA